MANNISRRGFIGGMGAALLAGASTLGVAGCGTSNTAESSSSSQLDFDLSDWDAVLDAAKDTKVSVAGYGGYATFNSYMNDTAAPYILDKYGVEMEWVEFDVESDIVALVNNEKSAGKAAGEGTHDIIWITMAECGLMQEMGSIYEDVRDCIPNIAKYMDPSDPGLVGFGGVELNTTCVSWGPLSYLYLYNAKDVSWTPKGADEFLKWCQEYEGKMTYPDATSYGHYVWWPLLLDVLGQDWYTGFDGDSDPAEIQEAMEPGLEYLREVNPYLWNKGKSYPTFDQMFQFFGSGENWMMWDSAPGVIDGYIKEGVVADTSGEFIFEDVGLQRGYDNELVVPYNCPNIAGALVVENALLEPELAYAKMQETGFETPLVYEKLSDDEKKIADSVQFVDNAFTTEQLASFKQIDQQPAELVDITTEIWSNEVAGKYN